jgi:hypothetical protein
MKHIMYNKYTSVYRRNTAPLVTVYLLLITIINTIAANGVVTGLADTCDFYFGAYGPIYNLTAAPLSCYVPININTNYDTSLI